MAMEIVNGYPCTNCSEATQAAKGINPAEKANGGLPEPKVEANAADNRPRASLDYAQVLDKLV